MKLSELSGNAAPQEDSADSPLPYPTSSVADPPITVAEARAAKDSICPFHNGLVRETGDVEGRVFWCPVGGTYWRWTKNPANAGMYAPLPYAHERVV